MQMTVNDDKSRGKLRGPAEYKVGHTQTETEVKGNKILILSFV